MPLESRDASGYYMAFDSTNGTATGIAINNETAQPVTVPITLRDGTGAQIGTESVSLNANGHAAFVLASQFPETAVIGTAEFDAPLGAVISVLGIRTPSTLTFTTLPPLVK